ncbi:hypothetical protein LCGC14_2197320 [marine sediment metagenome]|uniref:Uncharacterized protein n=1 Tax=marine sediment metagenome TaxID=412755 RepID=A0A0F9DHX0_9ZZZZ
MITIDIVVWFMVAFGLGHVFGDYMNDSYKGGDKE